MAGNVQAARAQQLLQFPLQQASFLEGLRQQSFANRAGLLQGTGQLGLGLAGIPSGATQGFLGLAQNPRLAQTSTQTIDLPGASKSALSEKLGLNVPAPTSAANAPPPRTSTRQVSPFGSFGTDFVTPEP